MLPQPLFFAVMAFAALQLAFWGLVIRMNDPSGLVHGFGDLARLTVGQRLQISRFVGNCLFAMALAILGFGAMSYLFSQDPITIIASTATLVLGISTLVLYMKRQLVQFTRIAEEKPNDR